MSNREKAYQLLDFVPEYKIGYVVAYLQGLTVDEDNKPNADTIMAFREGDEMLENGTGETYNCASDLFAALEAE